MNTVTFLLIGYSCLSYYKGVSIKAQKWLVNLSLLYVIYPIIRIATSFLYNDKNEEILAAMADSDVSVSQLLLVVIFILIILPIIIIALFRKYYYMKKHSSLKIFKRDGLALLLLLIFIVLYIVFFNVSMSILSMNIYSQTHLSNSSFLSPNIRTLY